MISHPWSERRRAKGFPHHTPPHPFRQAGEYFITAANYMHQPILNTSERIEEFEKLVLESAREAEISLIAWVFMPNHYHLLLETRSLNFVSSILMRVHGSTARKWNTEDECTGSRKVWYKFSDRAIHDETHHFRVMNYIHYNPVKHSYVKHAIEWPWTSIHSYYETNGRAWLIEKWKQFSPGKIGKGWDE